MLITRVGDKHTNHNSCDTISYDVFQRWRPVASTLWSSYRVVSSLPRQAHPSPRFYSDIFLGGTFGYFTFIPMCMSAITKNMIAKLHVIYYLYIGDLATSPLNTYPRTFPRDGSCLHVLIYNMWLSYLCKHVDKWLGSSQGHTILC